MYRYNNVTMNIFKLSYIDKNVAIADLLEKGVFIYSEDEYLFGEGVQSIVEIGVIMLEQPTFDEEGNELTPPILADGYHYDVMSTEMYDFGTNLVKPKNPKHAFAGWEINDEVTI